jgi:hypothetical protein
MRKLALTLFFNLWTLAAIGQETQPAPQATGETEDRFRLKLSAEVKAHFRWSEEERFAPRFPFPQDFIPQGQQQVELRTVASGSSFEISTTTVFLDVELPRSIAGRVKIDFIDLYDRNPTSGDQPIDVDEVWVRFGRKYESLEALPGSSFYALFGKAPKFERQNFRKLESYGLVSTAFNRFEDIQLQFGGSVGSRFYFRAQVSNGNPTFFRDPNALAGDNGTEDNRPPNPDPTLGSGFPIFYHAEAEELELDDKPEVGVGLGLRFLSADLQKGVDVLGFYYRTRLSAAAKLRGTFYEGDLDLLDGAGGISLPISGDERTEYGFNLDSQVGNLGVFMQWVSEEAASLPRSGVEVEAGYKFIFGDPADPNDLFTTLQPVVRYSRLDNDFTGPREFVAPSVLWDWVIWNFGARVGIRPGLDLTVEYAYHDIKAARKVVHDEFLTTLRFRF